MQLFWLLSRLAAVTVVIFQLGNAETTNIEPFVTSISPNECGQGGGVHVRVQGGGFKINLNKLEQPEIMFECARKKCEVDSDGSSSSNVLCHSPSGLPKGNCQVCVKDRSGGKVLGCENINVRGDRTPEIWRITPNSGGLSQAVTIYGKIRTDIYGIDNKNQGEGTEDETPKLNIIQLGDVVSENMMCKPTDSDIPWIFLSENFYGISLSHKTDYALCNFNYADPGNHNVSMLVKQTYGRSVQSLETIAIDSNLEKATFQVYPEITKMEPSGCTSTQGGARLTITGGKFTSNSKVSITTGAGPGKPCEIVKRNATQIVCLTPALGITSDDTTTEFRGGRGLQLQVYHNYHLPANDPDRLDTSHPNISTTVTDKLFWVEDAGEDNFYANFSGYFIFPQKVITQVNEYKFLLKSDDLGWLFLGNETDPKTYSTYTKFDSNNAFTNAITDTYQAPEEGAIKIGVSVQEWAGGAYVKMALRHVDVDRTHYMDRDCQDEKHKVTISSVIQDAEYVIVLSRLDEPKNARPDKFKWHFVMKAKSDDVPFHFKLYNTFSVQLSSKHTKAVCKNALNDLIGMFYNIEDPGINIKIDEENINEGNFTKQFEYEITANEGLGELSMVTEAKVETVTVDDNPRQTEVIFTMNDYPSDIVTDVTDCTQIENSLRSLLVARPAPVMVSIAEEDIIFSTSFETGDDPNQRIVHDALSGRYVLYNPYVIFEGDLKTSITLEDADYTLCIGARVAVYTPDMQITLTVKFSFKQTPQTATFDLTWSVPHNSTDWDYNCFRLKNLAEAAGAAATPKDKKRSDVNLKDVQKVTYKRQDTAVEFDDFSLKLIDDTFDILNDPATLQRRKPALDIAHHIEDIYVKSCDVDDGVTTVTVGMATKDCFNQLPHIGVLGMQELVHDGEIKMLGFPGISTSTDNHVNTTRTQASGPITGTFDIGDCIGMPYDIMEEHLQRCLETKPGAGHMRVDIKRNCSHSEIFLTWLSVPGKREQTTSDVSGLSGNGITTSSNYKSRSYCQYPHMFGDNYAMVCDTPQVLVSSNKIAGKCTTDDSGCGCSFCQSDRNTPKINSITPNSGSCAASTTITLTGTKLEIGNISVALISDDTKIPCLIDATTMSRTSLECSLNCKFHGTYNIRLQNDWGYAKAKDNSISFTCIGSADSINPTSGPAGGGYLLTITGSSLGPNPDGTERCIATVNDKPCKLKTSTDTEIQCTIPPKRVMTDPLTADVNVTCDGTLLSSGLTYTYQTDISTHPVIRAINVTQTTVLGTAVRIIGENFGDSAPDSSTFEDVAGCIFLNSGNIESWSDTRIKLQTPPHAPGSFCPCLWTSQGCADLSTNQIPDLEVKLEIHDTEPRVCSVYGGVDVIIAGEGFIADDTDVEFCNGSSCHNCEISVITATQIDCHLDIPPRTHLVTDNGLGPAGEPCGSWSPRVMEIYVEDSITWKWNCTRSVPAVIGVLQMSNCSMSEAMPNGTDFTQNSVGEYTKQFNENGTFYFSGGTSDIGKNLTFAVTVVDVPETNLTGSVRSGGYEAIINPTQARRKKRATSNSCEPVTSSCNGNANANSITATPCSTPTATSFSPAVAHPDSEMTITGSGFGTRVCAVTVQFGDTECDVIAVTNTEIKCTLQHNNTMDTECWHKLKVNIYNLGNIQVSTNTGLCIKAVVQSCTPLTGAPEGGTKVTIYGLGLVDVTKVEAGSDELVIDTATHTYTSIEVKTNMSSAGDATVPIKVYKNFQGNEELVTSTADCNFVYDDRLTMRIRSVSPKDVSGAGPTTLTLGGNKLCTTTTDLSIKIGDHNCTVLTAEEDSATCSLAQIPAASDLKVKYSCSNGDAVIKSGISISASATFTSKSLSAGSIYGGTVVEFIGTGFPDNVGVMIGAVDVSAHVTRRGVSSLTLATPATAAGTEDVKLVVNGDEISAGQFVFSESLNVTDTSPKSATTCENSVLTITTETKLTVDTSDVTVTLRGAAGDEFACAVASVDPLRCTMPRVIPGTYSVQLTIDDIGKSNIYSDAISCQWTMSSVTPSQGSRGGYQQFTVSGESLSEGSVVEVCEEPATITSVTSTAIVAETPVYQGNETGDVECIVKVTFGSSEKMTSNNYTYKASLTPEITSISPETAGTGGGADITLTGQGFGTDESAVSVEVDGIPCVVQSVSDTTVVCTLGPKPRVPVQYGEDKPCNPKDLETLEPAEVVLRVGTDGAAVNNGKFTYVDRWSSTFTWGGESPPAENDFVVIEKGQIILLDMDTPILQLLLIRGGQLIFDEEKDLELKAEKILITDCGSLKVGSEQRPFPRNATITLYGNHQSKKLPIYGTKNIAVRQGSLELHGIKMFPTWVLLASTAEAGDKSIRLLNPVPWNVGDKIVIATTGGRHSQRETEVREITDIRPNRKTLTLDKALEYKHLGETIPVDTDRISSVDIRGEVALLTHNVKVQGYDDAQWHTDIEECENGFDTGEFETQTCFQGRFGDEQSTNQFGGQIIAHPSKPNAGDVVLHISNIELTFVGQAFHLGRYPIHFHILGDAKDSYVRGCSIHRTFNRAINVHATHNVLLEHNVGYNVMGGAMFLEDGIERNNTLQYNLLIKVIASSSLLNDDITPASFWVTNPDNIIQHNRAAGGTHFGYWYRMHHHPDGPSFDRNICPDEQPMGVFQNNTAHSMGWFGVWIFTNYAPKLGGGCGGQTEVAAEFHSLTAWHCEKCFESVRGAAMQLVDAICVANEKAGAEYKFSETGDPYGEGSAMVRGSVFIAKTWATSHVMNRGIISPFGKYFKVVNCTFIDFEDDGKAAFGWTKIDGTCSINCGGFQVHSSGIELISSNRVVDFRWGHEGTIIDTDGSLSGTVGGRIMPHDDLLDCEERAEFSVGLFKGDVCPSSKNLIRFAANNPSPSSLLAKDMRLRSESKSTIAVFKKKAVTHAMGWHAQLPANQTFTMSFVNAEQITNISLKMMFYYIQPYDWIIMRTKVSVIPDIVKTKRGANKLDKIPTPENSSGDWYANEDFLYFLVRGMRTEPGPGKDRFEDKPINLVAQKCYYENCIVPVSSEDGAQLMSTPVYAKRLSKSDFTITNNADLSVPDSEWWVIDTQVNKDVGSIILMGHLEVTADAGELTTDNILIGPLGGLIIGWPNDTYNGDFTITLRGNHDSDDSVYPGEAYGPNMGAKAIAVFGRLFLFGTPRDKAWTTLASTANEGTNQITLTEAVDWVDDEEIAIASTSYDPHQLEVRKITAVSANKKTLTLNETLEYKHLGVTTTKYDIRAEVGLITRNIKIRGELKNKMLRELFGARILIGIWGEDDSSYDGQARIKDVEFIHTGQEGFTERYDPRYSIAFLDVSCNPDECYVKNCAFLASFSPSLGSFGANNIKFEDNLIVSSIGEAIKGWSADLTVSRNLIMLTWWPGAINGRAETFNFVYPAAIDLQLATSVTVEDNVVAGSERAAYILPNYECIPDKSKPSSYALSGNKAHSVLLGIMYLREHDTKANCIYIEGFTIYKAYYTAVYVQSSASIVIKDMLLFDNKLAIFTLVYGPTSLSHERVDKQVYIKDCTIIGRSPHYNCGTDVMPSYTHISLSDKAKPLSLDDAMGIIFPTFASTHNNAGEKKFLGITSYPAIRGVMKISGTYFGGFKNNACGNKYDVAISANTKNQDTQHPIEISDTKWGTGDFGVDEERKLFIPWADVNSVNPADCVDMECDALKTILLKDKDGTFFGNSGLYAGASAYSKSEHEWDGDKRRGIGDYRIPTALLTAPDGSPIPVEDIASCKGTDRVDNDCTYIPEWQAYKCEKQHNYEMFVIESMDPDTETRRLSPVALLGEHCIFLLNGPMDHGWCSGYTCQKRISTFNGLVRTGTKYKIHFTSTSPQSLRLSMLNAEDSVSFLVGIFYDRPGRRDVYVDGTWIHPNNGEMKNNELVYIGDDASFMPQIGDDAGKNLFDRNTSLLWISIKGQTIVDIKTSPLILVSFTMPAMTVDEFYGEDIISNLAEFLDIDESRIRITKIIAATSRRKRSTDEGVTVEFEISPGPPKETLEEAETAKGVSVQRLEVQSARIVDEIQLGNMSEVLGVEVLTVSIEEPDPLPDSEEWRRQASSSPTITTTSTRSTTTTVSSNSGLGATTTSASTYSGNTGSPTQSPTYEPPTTESPQIPTNEVLIPESLVFNYDPIPGREGSHFALAPSVRVIDAQGRTVTLLSSSSTPWKVSVTLIKRAGSDSRATLTGTTELPLSQGRATFNNLGISHSGSGYYLEFRVTYPLGASRFTVTTGNLTVKPRQLVLSGRMTAYDSIVGRPFKLTLMILDASTGAIVSDLAWKGHTWSVYLYKDPSSQYPGSLLGGGQKTFNNNGTLDMTLEFTAVGFVWFSAQVTTDPVSDYDLHFTTTKALGIYSRHKEEHIKGVVKRVALQLASGAIAREDTKEQQIFASSVANQLASDYSSVTVVNFTMEIDTITSSRKRRAADDSVTTPSPFNVYVVVYIVGGESNVSAVIGNIQRNLDEGMSFDYKGESYTTSGVMLVNGETYSTTKEAETGMSLGLILGIVFGVVALILIIIVIIIVCIVHKSNSSKKTGTKSVSEQHLMEQSQTSLQLNEYKKDVNDEERMVATPIYRSSASPTDMDNIKMTVPGAVPPRRLEPIYQDGEARKGCSTSSTQPETVAVLQPKLKEDKPMIKDPNWFGWYEGKEQEDNRPSSATLTSISPRPNSASSYSNMTEPSA